MTTDQISSALREYILTDRDAAELDGELTDDYLLIDSGFLDSLAVFNLVIFIEEEFGVVLHDEDLIAENFGTITAIASLIESRQPTNNKEPGSR